MIPLSQQARQIAEKAAAASNHPRAMLLQVEFRSFLTDLAMLLIEMAKRIETNEKREFGDRGAPL